MVPAGTEGELLVSKDNIHPIDRIVGHRLRLARTSRKLSQTQLAEASGITFQQVQKYEKGTNRVSASRLFEFATLLGIEISYFFEGSEETSIASKAPARSESFFDVSQVDIEILKSLWQLDAPLKRKFLDLINCLSSATDGTKPRKREASAEVARHRISAKGRGQSA
jgi:transcriptional regulator with XRE-family HTH domain